MLVRAPLMEAEQDGSIRIQDLTKVVMVRRRLGLAEERLVPFQATYNVADAHDRPRYVSLQFRCRPTVPHHLPAEAGPARCSRSVHTAVRTHATHAASR